MKENLLERTFAAVAFAERGIDPSRMKEFGVASGKVPLGKTLSDLFSAVALAEANCPDAALEILHGRRARASLGDFLRDVGLSHVPVRLCVIVR